MYMYIIVYQYFTDFISYINPTNPQSYDWVITLNGSRFASSSHKVAFTWLHVQTQWGYTQNSYWCVSRREWMCCWGLLGSSWFVWIIPSRYLRLAPVRIFKHSRQSGHTPKFHTLKFGVPHFQTQVSVFNPSSSPSAKGRERSRLPPSGHTGPDSRSTQGCTETAQLSGQSYVYIPWYIDIW